jgi:hypothetical protein
MSSGNKSESRGAICGNGAVTGAAARLGHPMRAIDEKTASKVLQIAATGSTQIQPESAPMGRGSLWLCLGLFVSMMTGIVYGFFRNMSDFPFHWSPTVGLSIAIFFFILAVLRSLT